MIAEQMVKIDFSIKKTAPFIKQLTVVSGMERSGFPETTVHYFCKNMKGAKNS